jgi:Domain of unknown function (DUF4440)
MRFVSFTVTAALISAGSLMAGQTIAPPQQPSQGRAQTQAAPAGKPTADQESVLRVLRHIAHAEFQRDVAAFQRLTADEFVHLGPDGALTNKQDWLRILEDEPPRLTTPPEPLDAPIQLAPGTLVRVVGTTAVVVAAQPSAVEDQSSRVVTVLVKRGAEWQQLLVNRQVIERPTQG